MKLVITLPARSNLKKIHDYYKDNVSTHIADKIKSGIISKLKFVSQNPLAVDLSNRALNLEAAENSIRQADC